MNADLIKAIVAKHRGSRGALIAILEDIQAKLGNLPAEALQLVADETGFSLVDIYGVATFYRAFSLKPRGKHLVSVCVGTACHVRGAPLIVQEFEHELRIKAGDTTGDREFTLETVNCLGACALGPIVTVDGNYFSKVDAAKVKNIIADTRQGLETVEVRTDQRVFPVDVSCSHCNHSLMDPRHLINGYPSIRITVSFERQHGWLRLSGLYGSYAIESEYDVPLDTVVNFFCPHCHSELRTSTPCPQCSAPMVSMIVRKGGMLQICARRGCKSHMLDLNGVNL